MSDTATPPTTASKRAASPLSAENGTASKRPREDVEGAAETAVTAQEGEDHIILEGEQETENGNETANGNEKGEVKKMDDVSMEGSVIPLYPTNSAFTQPYSTNPLT